MSRDLAMTNALPLIRVAVVEDDPGLIESLREILERAPDTRCVGTCTSAEEAMAELHALRPDIVLMDVNLPRASGVDAITRLAPQMPDTQFLMLTVYDTTEVVYRSLVAGAIGYLRKPVAAEPLLEAIREARAGGAPMTGSIARRVIQSFRKPVADARTVVETTLAPREQELLRLLAKGYQQKEIATEMDISISTVRTFIARIYQKLHVKSRVEAVARFKETSS